MTTRTRNALVFAVVLAALSLAFAWLWTTRKVPDLRGRALDAVPAGALMVVTVDLDALRASPVGVSFLKQGREIPGVGKVRDVCGFDPIDSLHDIAFAVPAAGDSGEFGLSAAGDVDDEALVRCASKTIEARGGRAIVTNVSGFRVVQDASADQEGEIAVRKGGPILLGAGPYLRAMIDASEQRTASVRSSAAHNQLASAVGEGVIRATLVLSPDQRRSLAIELEANGAGASPAGSVLAGAVSLTLGERIGINAVIACENASSCGELAKVIDERRTEGAKDVATRIVGFGDVLERLAVEPKGSEIHARVDVPASEAVVLLERLVQLRGVKHPMPGDRPKGSPGPDSAGGSPSVDAGTEAPNANAGKRDGNAGVESANPDAGPEDGGARRRRD